MHHLSPSPCAGHPEFRTESARRRAGEFVRPHYHVTMNVTVNGTRHALPQPCTIEVLLDRLELGRKACAVEVNTNLVPRRDHGSHELNEGDDVEIVTLVGGG